MYACALGAREYEVSIFGLVFIILRDHHKLVTKGFLHSFVADRGFSLGLKKFALGLRTISPYLKLQRGLKGNKNQNPRIPLTKLMN